MTFRNYCMVVMKTTSGILDEIEKISENKPNSFVAGGIVIITFTSAMEPKELNDWLTLDDRNFMFFELSEKSSGFNFLNKNIQEGLFGFLSQTDLKEKNIKFLNDINVVSSKPVDSIDISFTIEDDSEISEVEIEKMSKSEKQEMFDKLLDMKVWSEKDKKLMQLLAK